MFVKLVAEFSLFFRNRLHSRGMRGQLFRHGRNIRLMTPLRCLKRLQLLLKP